MIPHPTSPIQQPNRWALLAALAAASFAPLLTTSAAEAHMQGMFKTKQEAEKRAVELNCKGALPWARCGCPVPMSRRCTRLFRTTDPTQGIPMSRRHLRRRIHRALVPIAAIPLIITALSGSIYGLMLANNIDAFWLLKVHTGNFGMLNLQPYYSAIIGILTLIIAISGVGLLLGGPRKRPASLSPKAKDQESGYENHGT